MLAPGPHYPPYMAYPQMYGAETVEYQLHSNDEWKPDFSDIREMDDDVRLLVLINPNNPCGTVCGPAEVDALLAIARDYPNCIVVADEIYDGLDFTGQHVSVASQFGRSRYCAERCLKGVLRTWMAHWIHGLARSTNRLPLVQTD